MLHRHTGSWMVICDERILEHLNKDGPQPPSKLADHKSIHSSPSNISRRLGKIADHDLAEAVGNGVYQITREGRLYLLGGFDAETGDVLMEGDELLAQLEDDLPTSLD